MSTREDYERAAAQLSNYADLHHAAPGSNLRRFAALLQEAAGRMTVMERDHEAMDALRENLAPRFAWIFDGFDLKQCSKDVGYDDPADAMLGPLPPAPGEPSAEEGG